MIKRALVLSGGGSKGAWQLGALKALAEVGRSWNSVHGISVGALNGSWIAMHPPEEHPGCVDGLIKVWDNVRTSDDIYEPWAPCGLKYIWSMWKGSLNSGAPLRKLVKSYWNSVKLATSGVKLTVGCASLTSGLYAAIDGENANIMEYVLASSHMPLIFEPLIIDNQQWIDGGIRHQIPILEALKENPDEIDVVITSPISETRIDRRDEIISVPGVALRLSEIVSDQIYVSDFFTVMRAAKSVDGLKINIYSPSVRPNTDSMDFDHLNIETGIQMGYEETKKKLDEEVAEAVSILKAEERL